MSCYCERSFHLDFEANRNSLQSCVFPCCIYPKVSRPFLGSKTAQKSVLHFKTSKKDYQQEADLELGAKTWRVRISLGSKVYAIDNQVVIAIWDEGSYDFKEDNFGSFFCS